MDYDKVSSIILMWISNALIVGGAGFIAGPAGVCVAIGLIFQISWLRSEIKSDTGLIAGRLLKRLREEDA